MDSSELAFFTTQELVDELLRRKTFLGVIIHADEQLRTAAWERGTKEFRVRFNDNLGRDEAGRLLDVVADKLAEAA